MEPRRRFRFVALALGGILLFAAGCRSSHDTRPATPSGQGEAKATTCPPLKDESASGHQSITVGDGFNASCRWTIRRTWYPGQSRLKSEGCTSVQRR